MNTTKTLNQILFAATVSVAAFTSCQRNDAANDSTTDTSSTIAIAASPSAAATGTAGAPTDSVYVLQSCGKGGRRDSIAQASLPAPVSSYLSANYSGYTFNKAFAVKNRTSSLTGYVVVVYYNNNPVALEFDSAGAFVRVLEQREKGDLGGPGHHRGGHFEHRDGQDRDSIALSALPSAVTAYFSANNASDTLVKAFRSRDNGIVVLSKNSTAYATVFTADGAFVKRTTLPTRSGQCAVIELSSLPSAAASYLSQTYPNYAFKKAFSIRQNGVLNGFVVFIDANNTKYALTFDDNGAFVSAKTI